MSASCALPSIRPVGGNDGGVRDDAQYSPLHGNWLEWRLSRNPGELQMYQRGGRRKKHPHTQQQQDQRLRRVMEQLNRMKESSGRKEVVPEHVYWSEKDAVFNVLPRPKYTQGLFKHQIGPRKSISSSRTPTAALVTKPSGPQQRRRKADILCKRPERSSLHRLEERLDQLREAQSQLPADGMASLGPEDSSILSLCRSLASGSTRHLQQSGQKGRHVKSVEPIDWKKNAARRRERFEEVLSRREELQRLQEEKLRLKLTEYRLKLRDHLQQVQERELLALKAVSLSRVTAKFILMMASARRVRDDRNQQDACALTIQRCYRAHVQWRTWTLLRQSTQAVRFAMSRLRICAARARDSVQARRRNEAAQLVKTFLSSAGSLLATSAMRLFRRRVIRCQSYMREYLRVTKQRISLLTQKWARVEASLDTNRMQQYQKRLLEMKAFDMATLSSIIKGMEATRKCDREKLSRLDAAASKMKSSRQWHPGNSMQELDNARREAEVMVRRGIKFKVIPGRLRELLLRRLLRSMRLAYKVTYWFDQVEYMEHQQQENRAAQRGSLAERDEEAVMQRQLSTDSCDALDLDSVADDVQIVEEKDEGSSVLDDFDEKIRERLQVIMNRRTSRPPGLLPLTSFVGSAWTELVVLAERCAACGISPQDDSSPMISERTMAAADLQRILQLHSGPSKSANQVEQEAANLMLSCYGLEWEEAPGSVEPPAESATQVAPHDALNMLEADVHSRIFTPLPEK